MIYLGIRPMVTVGINSILLWGSQKVSWVSGLGHVNI